MKSTVIAISLVVVLSGGGAAIAPATALTMTPTQSRVGLDGPNVILAGAIGENKIEKACKKRADEMKLIGLIRSDYIQRCVASRSFRDPNVPRLPGADG